ncbi:Transcription Factor E2F8 [Manis pentadactyla]|nr:Transcription Factor E2F8 [Manis pentadactyla]
MAVANRADAGPEGAGVSSGARDPRRGSAQPNGTRLAATGLKKETPESGSAKEIWLPTRARSLERNAQEVKKHCWFAISLNVQVKKKAAET